jgi:hypothetical protein
MQGDRLLFEAEPFELEEGEAWRRQPAAQRWKPPMRPKPRPRPRGRPVGPSVWVAQPYGEPGPGTADGRACETVLVLEGFATGQMGLATHHGPMLQRLASYLSRSGQRPQGIEVDGRNAQGKADRRAEAAARFLRTRVRGLTVRTTSSRTQGPERVEIRFCFPDGE